jgi:hypothetical protein
MQNHIDPLGNLFLNSFRKLGGVVILPPKAEDIIKVVSEYELCPYWQLYLRFQHKKSQGLQWVDCDNRQKYLITYPYMEESL